MRKMKTHRRRLECESLETRALLSGAAGHISAHDHAHAPLHAHLHAQAMMSGHGHGASVAAEVAATSTSSPVTGGGLVGGSTAPGSGDVGAMQSAASGNELVIFLTQFEDLSGSNPATQQTATSILNDSRNVGLALDGFASGLGVTLPGNITGNAQSIAQQMISGYRGGNTDQTYSSLIIQAESSLVAQFQQMASGAQDPALRSFAASMLPTLQADLAAAQGTGTLAPVSSNPSSTTLDSSDLTTIETYYSIDAMESFLGQLTLLVTTNHAVSQYSAKLIGDHEQGNVTLGMYAASTGTYLPAAISAGNAPMATTVIAALHTVRPRSSSYYDLVYLKQMIMGHTAALKYTQTVVATAQNPVVKQFAINVGPTIYMHLLAARTTYYNLTQ